MHANAMTVAAMGTVALAGALWIFSSTGVNGDPSPQSALPARLGTVPDALIKKHLSLPVPGIHAEDLVPQFYDARGERGHEALDIIAIPSRSRCT